MVRSDLAASGVMFTLDTESGFNDVVFITGAQGLGEMVVQGAVNPDEFYVHKPTLKAGRPAVVRKTLGSKLIKMTYSGDAGHGRQVKVVDTTDAERNRFCITDEEVMALAKAGPHHRAALRSPDGHRVGQGWSGWQALHRSGPSGNRA